MDRKLSLFALAATVAGVGLAAVASPKPSRAQTGAVQTDVAINPGGTVYFDGSNYVSGLSCGWHSTCLSPYAYGPGLDWASPSGGAVSWRSWSWRSDACTCPIGQTQVRIADSNCYQIAQDIGDWYSVFRGTELYIHTTSPWGGYWNTLTAGAQYWYNNEWLIGYAVSQDLPNCPFEGSHTHQQSNNGFTQASTYPSSVDYHPDPPYTPYPVTANGWWQNNVVWCFYC